VNQNREPGTGNRESVPGSFIVIGAGFAGLSAATALAERGARVLVLEARPVLGGRATAHTDPATGERVDNGQHILIGCYRETFAFLDRIGARDGVAFQENLTIQVIDRAGRSSRLACPAWPAPFHLLGGVLRWTALSWRDRWAVLRIIPALKTAPRTRPARDSREGGPDVSVREWLVRAGQTPRLLDVLWEPLAVAALNESIDVASAAPFREVLRRMFSTHRRDSALGLPVVPLDDLYAKPACAYLAARGGEVRLTARARVRVESGRPVVVVQGEELKPEAVICAVPWYALGGLFESIPSEVRDAIDAAERTPASAIVTVNLWLDRAVTTGTFIGLPGRAMQWVFDKGALFGSSSSHLSLVSSGASHLVARTNDELVALALTELREALPAARDATVRRATVVRERRATFSAAPGLPRRPETRTGIDGLYLAGDWIDTGLPATIESAVLSGHRAAAAALGDS
jgi:squalene-associated FAD-dependent desaturase